jgi:sugar phosphate isomerase/epimerase
MIKLGYSTGTADTPLTLSDKIKLVSEFTTDAIEISYRVTDRMQERIGLEEHKLLQNFKYISIHAPVRTHDGKPVTYPGNGMKYIQDILENIKGLNVKVIVFHPDTVIDWKALAEVVPFDMLAVENMDNRKDFGQTVADLERVFKQVPHAKWVCDVNHFYTIDRSMNLADEFHNAFRDRLCHYHISGYGGLHDCFCNTQEDVIMNGVQDFSKPMINEGGAPCNRELMQREHLYVTQLISKKILS